MCTLRVPYVCPLHNPLVPYVLQALRCEAAAESDFGVATASGRASPSPEEWKQLFAKA